MTDPIDTQGPGELPPGASPHMDLKVSEGREIVLQPGEALTPEHVLDALRPIQDPEIFLSIVDLGLIYGVDVAENGRKVTVRMTLTGPGCPVGPQILAAVHSTVAKLPDVTDPDVQLTWDPPWNPVLHASEEAKDALGIW